MTDQIPAEKVRELTDKYEAAMPLDPNFLLSEIKADLRALLPTPPQPTTGLLGRWAKHPEHGDVVCTWDRPNTSGCMFVRWVAKNTAWSTTGDDVPLDSLTFPEQANRPEDVPAGEAWLVRDVDGREFNALKTSGTFPWRFFDGEEGGNDGHRNRAITLIAPLTPEHPGKDDLQARYDALEEKYREAVRKIAELKQTVTRIALRYGWGEEQTKQPAWRIEHDPDNLRVGEYIIDIGGDDGTLTRKWGSYWDIDGDTYVAPCFAPFIVFPNKDAATPEAILEAKRARDKEMEK